MNPFTNVNRFFQGIITDASNLTLTIATLGFIFCALMVWRGAEESVPRFQKAMVWIGGGIVVVVLAKVLVAWIRAGVA